MGKSTSIMTIIFIVAWVLYFAVYAFAEEPTEYDIVFEWEYVAHPDLVGFRIFQDGVQVIDINDKNLRTTTAKINLVNPTACFTMTAYGNDPDQESKQSPEYCVKRPLPMPIMTKPKYYRRYIDAGAVLLSPVK